MPNKEIKLRDFLTTGRYPIYSGSTALSYYQQKKYSARQLETWKHENIRYHLCFRSLHEYRLNQFREAINEPSGYCFETSLKKPVCKKCRITKTLGKPCYKTDEYFKLMQASTFVGFGIAHEKYCKKLKNNCWRKLWEEYPIDSPKKCMEKMPMSENKYYDHITGEEIPIPNEAPDFLPEDTLNE